jgi:hypothetical protein
MILILKQQVPKMLWCACSITWLKNTWIPTHLKLQLWTEDIFWHWPEPLGGSLLLPDFLYSFGSQKI